jgi:hypothetical protein
MERAWATDIRDQCRRAGVPFFFKQWGGRIKKIAGRVLGGRTWDELPVLFTGAERAANGFANDRRLKPPRAKAPRSAPLRLKTA